MKNVCAFAKLARVPLQDIVHFYFYLYLVSRVLYHVPRLLSVSYLSVSCPRRQPSRETNKLETSVFDVQRKTVGYTRYPICSNTCWHPVTHYSAAQGSLLDVSGLRPQMSSVDLRPPGVEKVSNLRPSGCCKTGMFRGRTCIRTDNPAQLKRYWNG